MKKIGLITIGQSPRNDIMSDILPILGNRAEILQKGALDNLSQDQLSEIAPGPCDTVLVSSLRDGTSVLMAEEKILKLLQKCIEELESLGVSGIMLLCTGDFKDTLSSSVPLLFPNKILSGLLPALCDEGKLLILVPEPAQKAEAVHHWRKLGIEAEAFALSPYCCTHDEIRQTAAALSEVSGDYVLLDCMGYSAEIKEGISDCCNKNIILPRTLLAAVLKELI